MCTLAKYAWMRRHWPDAERGTRWLNVAEWIVLGLGGEAGAEASLASRTGFYDLHTGTAWEPAMRWADAPATPRAAARPGRHAARPRRRAGAAASHGDARAARRHHGAVLAVGGHDHAAAAVGAGAAGEGDVLDSCGTAEAILRATAPLDPATVRRAVEDGFTVGRHALAGPLRAPGRVLVRRAAAGGHGSPRRGLTASSGHGLEEAGATGADVLARMEALAGPAQAARRHRRLVGGRRAREVKRRHLGPFEHVAEGYAGCRGAARAALRAAASRGS